MWLFQKQNHLPSSLSLKGWGPPQQPEPRSNCRMCPTMIIHRGACFSWSGGPLQEVHQGICMHCTAPQQVSCWGRGQQKLEWVLCTEEAMKAFEALKQACMTAPIFVFADYIKPFLLETNASKDGLGVVSMQKQADRQYHPIAYGSKALMPYKKNYHSTKLKILALKWVVTEHFKEYLPYQSFVVWTDNNPLMYIMSTPNLNTMGHQWISALAWFNVELEYQKGRDNMVVDVLSLVTTWLNPEVVKSILNGVTLGMAHHAKVHNPAMVEGNQHLEQEVCVATDQHWWRCMLLTGPKPRERTQCCSVECSVGLAEGTEADRFKDASGRTHLQWRR